MPLDEIWRAYLARFDEEHTFKFGKGAIGLIAAKLRIPEQTDRWVQLVMTAFTPREVDVSEPSADSAGGSAAGRGRGVSPTGGAGR